MGIKKTKNFAKKTDLNKYQVFICASLTSIPLIGFLHTYIVVNEKGKLTRWDVWHIKNRVKTSNGYVHKNTYKPWTGLSVLYGNSITKQKVRYHVFIVDTIKGNKGSLAHQMCDFINTKVFDYPLKNEYKFLGPNSNTFVQWFIDKFPDCGIYLPKRAVGRGYKHTNYNYN